MTTILKQFFKDPQATGAIAASSPGLARVITSEIGLETATTVVELGPGTGAFTGRIIKTIPTNATFFAVELNTEIVKAFQKRYPDVKIHTECATKLVELLKKENVESVDVVVSGLPWAAFPDQLQEDILGAVVESLAPGGVFTTFAYLQGLLLPAGKKFRKRLDDNFSSVAKSKTVWANLPPAFVYRCRK